MTHFSVYGPTMTPQDVADRFAAESFENRKSGTVKGRWSGRSYDGVFTLIDGVKQYKLTLRPPVVRGDRALWEVSE